MTEYGLFSDEGCFYGPCWSMAEAEKERTRFIEEEGEDPDDIAIREMCPDHEGEAKDDCDECYAEYDEDDNDKDDY